MALLGYFKPTSPNPYSTLSAENPSPMIWQENLAFCWRRRKILASSKTQTTYCGLCNYKSTSPRSGMDHESCSPSGLCQSYTLHLRFPIATCGGHIIFMHALRVRAHTAAGGYYYCFVVLHWGKPQGVKAEVHIACMNMHPVHLHIHGTYMTTTMHAPHFMH